MAHFKLIVGLVSDPIIFKTNTHSEFTEAFVMATFIFVTNVMYDEKCANGVADRNEIR